MLPVFLSAAAGIEGFKDLNTLNTWPDLQKTDAVLVYG